MARVPRAQAEAIAKAADSWGQFTVLEPGLYAATLEEVDTTREPGPSGADYWVWIFSYDNQPGKAFHNTSFSEKAQGSVGAVFRAFDADVREDDTDDLIGDKAILSISKGPVKSGPKKGQIRNYVEAVLPWREGFEDEIGGDGGGAVDGGNGDAKPARRARKAAGGASTGAEKPGDWE